MSTLDLFTSRTRGRDALGLDIGRRAVKAVRRDRGRIVARNLVPWEAPHRFDGEGGAGVLGDAIRRAVGTFGLKRRHRTHCVLSLSFGTLRSFELPPSSDEELLEMVRQEFATDDALDPSRAEVACWAAPTRSDLQPVCGWALEHGVSRYIVQECTRAGLDCAAIDALPFAVARATAALGGSIAEAPAAVVDWGAHSPSLTIVHRGRPLFTRSLRGCGHEGVVARLANGLNLSTNEAWDFFDNFGPRTDSAPELRQLLGEYAREVGQALVGEIERTIEFVGQRLQALAPRTILLLGGGAEIVREPLREAFGARVVTWAESHGDDAGRNGSAMGAAVALSGLEVAS